MYEEFTETLRNDINTIRGMSFDFKSLNFPRNVKKAEGIWNGQKVSVATSTAGYEFSDAEMQELFAGGSVTFKGVDFHKNPVDKSVKLGLVSYKGKQFVGYHDAEYYYGEFGGNEIRFKRKYMDHNFSDFDCEKLLAGETLEIVVTNRDDNKISISGKLEKQSIDGGPEFYGYKGIFPVREGYVRGTWKGKEITIKGSFSDHVFTETELERLFDDKSIVISYTGKSGDTQQVDGKIEQQSYQGRPFFGFKANFPTKRDS